MIAPQRRPVSIVLPVILIVVGAVLLLASAGVLSGDAGWRLLQLWPLILVLIGVQLVVSRTLEVRAAQLVALALVALLAVGAFAYVALGAATATAHDMTSSAALGDATSGRLTIEAAGVRLAVVAADTGDQLYRADLHYHGRAPAVTSSSGSLDIASGETGQFGGAADSFRLTLSSAVPWEVVIASAGLQATFEFGAGQLKSFTVSGVGSSANLQLGTPRGHVPVSVSGVGDQLTVGLPQGTEYSAQAAGLASAVGGARQTAGWSAAADRYDISASGVGAQVSVQEVNP